MILDTKNMARVMPMKNSILVGSTDINFKKTKFWKPSKMSIEMANVTLIFTSPEEFLYKCLKKHA